MSSPTRGDSPGDPDLAAPPSMGSLQSEVAPTEPPAKLMLIRQVVFKDHSERVGSRVGSPPSSRGSRTPTPLALCLRMCNEEALSRLRISDDERAELIGIAEVVGLVTGQALIDPDAGPSIPGFVGARLTLPQSSLFRQTKETVHLADEVAASASQPLCLAPSPTGHLKVIQCWGQEKQRSPRAPTLASSSHDSNLKSLPGRGTAPQRATTNTYPPHEPPPHGPTSLLRNSSSMSSQMGPHPDESLIWKEINLTKSPVPVSPTLPSTGKKVSKGAANILKHFRANAPSNCCQSTVVPPLTVPIPPLKTRQQQAGAVKCHLHISSLDNHKLKFEDICGFDQLSSHLYKVPESENQPTPGLGCADIPALYFHVANPVRTLMHAVIHLGQIRFPTHQHQHFVMKVDTLPPKHHPSLMKGLIPCMMMHRDPDSTHCCLRQYAVYLQDQTMMTVMEHLGGGSLADLISYHGSVDLKIVAVVAHQWYGVQCTEMKASRILVSEDGQVKIPVRLWNKSDDSSMPPGFQIQGLSTAVRSLGQLVLDLENEMNTNEMNTAPGEFPLVRSHALEKMHDFALRCLCSNLHEQWSPEQLLQHPLITDTLGSAQLDPRLPAWCVQHMSSGMTDIDGGNSINGLSSCNTLMTSSTLGSTMNTFTSLYVGPTDELPL
eukprot:gene6213-152_t